MPRFFKNIVVTRGAVNMEPVSQRFSELEGDEWETEPKDPPQALLSS